jgi:hypothetical protein
MTRLLLIFSFALSTIIAKGQLKADSLTIYKNFKGRGTTANLWRYQHDADSLKIELQKISNVDFATIKELFSGLKLKKHVQQKHGGELFLGFLYLNGQKYKCAINSRSSYTHFVNLTDHKHLMLQDSVQASKIHAILLKYSN